MKRFLTVTARTKRSPAVASGKRRAPELHLPFLKCTPLDPADGQTARDLAFRVHGTTNTPYVVLKTYVAADLDIIEGDLLLVGNREYPIRSVNVWQWRGNQKYLQILLEDVYVGETREQ